MSYLVKTNFFFLQELKSIVHILILLATAFVVGCEKYPEGSIEIVVASKQSYTLGENGLPVVRHIIRPNTEGGEWEVVDLRKTHLLNYQVGWEYTAMARWQSFEPEVFPQFAKKSWWEIDALVEKEERESDLPEDIYIYTPENPWGFDSRDPMLEHLLNPVTSETN